MLDLCFQGWAYINKGITPEYHRKARSFFERALVLDPDNVEALVGSAEVGLQDVYSSFYDDDRMRCLEAAEMAVIRVLTLAPGHPMAHNVLAAVHLFSNRVAQAIANCERALALDRNLAAAHTVIGMAKYFTGRGSETEAHIEAALRLSPRDIHAFRWLMIAGIAKLWQGADGEAVTWLRRSVEANRNFPLAHFYLAAALAHLGELGEARAAARAGLKLHPSFTISRYRASAACNHPAYLAGRERTYEGLRLAKVPEG